jgi:hypothetical protein
MKNQLTNDEIRWQVVKAMLEEFPSLKVKVCQYLQENTPAQTIPA